MWMMQFTFVNVCSKCKSPFFKIKFGRIQELRHSTASIDIGQENLEVLKQLGFDEFDVQYVNKQLTRPTKEPARLKLVVDRLQDLGFSSKEIKNHFTVLKKNAKVIDNRFKVLKEGGFYRKKITVPLLNTFFTPISRSVEDLKENGFIGKKTIVTKNILSHSDFPPDSYPSNENQSDRFDHLQTAAVNTYLCWKFDVSKKFVDKVLKIIKTPIRSIELIMESYNFLTENIGLTHDQIRKNMYLLYHNAEDYLRTLEKVPSVGPVPMLTIVKSNPKVLMRPAEKLLQKIEVLKELGLPLESILAHADILLLSVATIRQRVQFLQSDPDFQPYLHNPRVMKAVIFFNNVTRRYKLLKDINWRCQSFDLLSSRAKVFHNRLKTGNDMSKGHDILHYLHSEMEMTRLALRKALKLNPVWYLVPLSTVTANLQLFRKRGFTDSQIRSALTVLLYPNLEVEKCLDELDSRPEVDCCRDPRTNTLKPDLVLQLVLYYLERPYHFNGNGIFTNQPLLNHDLMASLNLDIVTNK